MTHVLVVEDSDTVSEFLRWALTTGGNHTVTLAMDHRERLLNPADPRWEGVDVLITDLLMPEVNGIEILQTARNHFPHIRRLCLTGVEEQDPGGIINTARSLSEQVLEKPSQMDEILAAVSGG